MKFQVYLHGKQVSDQILLQSIHDTRDERNPIDLGLFESLRTYRGNIFRLNEHLDRFFDSARTVVWKHALDRKKLKQQLQGAVRAYQKERGIIDVFIRLSLWNDKAFVIVGERKHPKHIYEKGVSLKTSSIKRSWINAETANVKTSAYQNSVLATLDPLSEKDYDQLLLDHDGFITESRVGNFFMVKEGVLKTPPTLGILNGVTRRFVIECALSLGIPVEEMPLMRHEVYNADEAFLTNTSWEILPVAKLDGRSVRSRIPGKVTKELHQRFREIVKKECP